MTTVFDAGTIGGRECNRRTCRPSDTHDRLMTSNGTLASALLASQCTNVQLRIADVRHSGRSSFIGRSVVFTVFHIL